MSINDNDIDNVQNNTASPTNSEPQKNLSPMFDKYTGQPLYSQPTPRAPSEQNYYQPNNTPNTQGEYTTQNTHPTYNPKYAPPKYPQSQQQPPAQSNSYAQPYQQQATSNNYSQPFQQQPNYNNSYSQPFQQQPNYNNSYSQPYQQPTYNVGYTYPQYASLTKSKNSNKKIAIIICSVVASVILIIALCVIIFVSYVSGALNTKTYELNGYSVPSISAVVDRDGAVGFDSHYSFDYNYLEYRYKSSNVNAELKKYTDYLITNEGFSIYDQNNKDNYIYLEKNTTNSDDEYFEIYIDYTETGYTIEISSGTFDYDDYNYDSEYENVFDF